MALRPEFDGVRRYARYAEGAYTDHAVPTALNHNIEGAVAAFTTREHHALYLATADVADGRREAVFIALRGKVVGRVDLTRGRPGLPPGAWMLTRFHEADRTFEGLAFPQDMPRALLNPEALGLQDVWPEEWL